MFCYSGRILHVNLSAERSRVESIDESTLRRYIGGVGLGVRLLLDNLPPGVDPLGPENVIVITNSVFSGTLMPVASKFAFVTKSPLTGFIGDSLSGSFFAQAMKRAGWDAIVITGKARRLTYLFIDDDRIFFRNATKLAGLGCFDTEEAIRAELDDEMVKVASIGLAGENMVRFACIGNDKGRQLGRTGTGAVMGSKNLKAVALRGTKPIEVADRAEMFRLGLHYSKTSQGPATQKYRAPGTVGNVLTLNRLGILPTRNFQTGVFEDAEEVSGERMMQLYTEKTVACGGCSIACDQVASVKSGVYQGARASVDYESLFALGTACGVSSLEGIIKAVDLCDRFGLDSMSTGVTIAWAMECFQRGLLTREDADGLDLTWGNHEAVAALVEKIARREPGIGDLLAEGTKRAADRIQQGSDAFAMNVKGLELPGYDPRGLQTYALGIAVCSRGACHNRAPGYEPDMAGKTDRLVAEPGRGQILKDLEDYMGTMDSIMVCKFLRKCFSDFWSESAHLYTVATGLEITVEDLRKAGERVLNMKKAFNIREGWRREDDWLPARLFDDPMPEGASVGAVVNRDELRLMIDAYYQARGWTEEGLIPESKLVELDLGDLVEKLGPRVPLEARV